MLEDISTPVKNTFPIPMEKLDQSYGYILYRTALEREQNLEKSVFGAPMTELIFSWAKNR